MAARARARARTRVPALPTAAALLVSLALLSSPPSARALDLTKHLAPSASSPTPALVERQDWLGSIFGVGGDDASSASASGTSAATSATGAASNVDDTSASVTAPSVGASSATSAAGETSASETSATSATSAPETSAPTSTPSSISESSSTSKSSSSSRTSSASLVVVTVTSIQTNADGSESTMLSASASAVTEKDSGGGGPSGKTWGIIGGVIGGVVLLAGLLLVIWRMTQRRFSDLDNGHDEIKWPELQPDGQTVSPGLTTLNPQGTRRTGGAGFEMEKDRFGEDEEGDDAEGRGLHEVQYAGAAGMGGQRGSYYDPYLGGPAALTASNNPNDSYLGPSAAPYPGPPNLSPAHNLYPPQPHSHSSSSLGSSPYMYPDAAATNSFSNPHFQNQSSEDVPLTAAAGGAGGIPYRAQATSPGPLDLRY
ncbi:hypothetical protein JCM11251_000945 [Rhodosporidiobolus azoricus]